MYLHLGQETVVKMDSIVGIFDLDTSTISKFTRDYLTQAEKKAAKWLTYLWNCQNPLWCARKRKEPPCISVRFLPPPC